MPPPNVTVFGSHPLLGITIEKRGEDQDDVHMHPAGQGVWVARMAAELGSHPILCGFIGGETGTVLRPLLDTVDAELRLVDAHAAAGCYVVDRRSGEREIMATAWSDPPSRHEIDDLFSVTVAAALESEVLVVCGGVPQDALPLEIYGNLVADARAGGTKTVVDLSPPGLNSALEGGPDFVKLDDWQLAEFLEGPATEPEQLRTGARRVVEQGAGCVMVTRGGNPALIGTRDKLMELVPPRFSKGASEGSGDSMVGALAASLARGKSMEEALRWGAAAGAANFLRKGLGTGSRDVVSDLLPRVELRELTD
ncbi:MAG TPA: PfkB family carbohydrate kinase [Solirubrobacterales bacterium]|nr:PfkB family carbohydrate kinase [Solirubrobacterales bacterium]